jgi:hypothetical protein
MIKKTHKIHKNINVVSALFQCQVCGKDFTTYKNAQATAAQHTKVYGHTVSGEITLSVEYSSGGVYEKGDSSV